MGRVVKDNTALGGQNGAAIVALQLGEADEIQGEGDLIDHATTDRALRLRPFELRRWCQTESRGEQVHLVVCFKWPFHDFNAIGRV